MEEAKEVEVKKVTTNGEPEKKSYLLNTQPTKRVQKTWDCPKCGETNREEALKCINCYADKPNK